MVLVWASVSASASSTLIFPEDADWTALPCAENPRALSFDPVADESDALFSQDIVGDDVTPAAYVYLSADTLFLRMRLDRDPFPGNEPLAHGWAFQLDLDDDRSDYEIMVLIDGIDGQVEVYQNTKTTLPNDRQDPPDQPAIDTQYLNTVRTLTAGTSTYGGDDDVFLDVAVPLQPLQAAGLGSAIYPAWVVTTGAGPELDGDVACSAGGGDGNPTDGELDTGIILEGGGGCQTGWSGGASLLVLAVLGRMARVRRASVVGGGRRAA